MYKTHKNVNDYFPHNKSRHGQKSGKRFSQQNLTQIIYQWPDHTLASVTTLLIHRL